MSGQFSIKKQMFFLAICIVVLMAGIGLLGQKVMRANEQSINSALRVKSLLILDEMYTRNIEDSLYRYLLGMATSEEALANIEVARQEIAKQWDIFKSGIKPEESSGKLDELEQLIQGGQGEISILQRLLVEGQKEKLQAHLKTDWMKAYDPILFLLHEISDDLIHEAQGILAERARQYSIQMITFLSFAVVIFLFSTWRIQRRIAQSLKTVSRQLRDMASGEADLTKRVTEHVLAEVREVSESLNRFIEGMSQLILKIKKSGLQVNNSTQTIGATALQLERTLNAFESSFIEATATIKQISATSQILAETMQDVSAVSAKTVDLATASKGSLAKMEATIQQMEGASSQISTLLYVIKEKAEKITKVVASIGSIASKTNLLSLNAAIQSEKAGEHGLGFAVVTREIRSLADMVGADSRNIAGIVSEMKGAVTSAVMEMDKFYNEVKSDASFMQKVKNQLTAIIEEVEALGPRYDTVNRGVQEQAEGACRVGESMEQVALGAQEALRSFRHVSTVIKQLDADSRDLQKSFSGFKIADETSE